MILVLIAASYTALALLILRGALAEAILIAIWAAVGRAVVAAPTAREQSADQY